MLAMSKDEFLSQMDEILGLPVGTIRGHEKLEELDNWDSTALVSFIALADTASGVDIPLEQIVNCSTVADLVRLAQREVAS
jgi:acyl carrier protein